MLQPCVASCWQSALKDIISWDAFCAAEIEIFRAVQSWVAHNPDSDASQILPCIRLPLMSLDELLNVVRPSSLLAPDSILDAIKTKTESRDMELSYRGFLSMYLLSVFAVFSCHSCRP